MANRNRPREKGQSRSGGGRIIAIGVIIIGAALVALALILPNLKLSSSEAVNAITPQPERSLNSGTSLGSPDAPVKVDVWEDFQCSACMFFSKNVEPEIVQAYVDTGKVFYTFHFYPFIDQFDQKKGEESHYAANAALCASEQGRFWDYHDMLFANWIGENVGSYTKARVVAFGQKLDLDMTAFNQCLDSQKYAPVIQRDMDAGSKLGVPPTPGIFVNQKMVVSSQGENYIPSFQDVSQAIEAALGK